MQGRLTSSEAWVRFACALYVEYEDMHTEDVAEGADEMLVEYEKRFPAPKVLTEAPSDTGSEEGSTP